MNRVLPILFNTDMVRAILDGRKTVTRRICKDGDDYTVPDMGFYDADKRTYAVHSFSDKGHENKLSIVERKCPICPGDILYVRETWHKYTKRVGHGENCRLQEFYGYKASIANSEDANKKWHPSIHMPKEAARIWLKVTTVRVEHLQNMSTDDFLPEGITIRPEAYNDPENAYQQAKEAFKNIWDATIKQADREKYGWAANPWVWVIEFERCEKPEVER